jgi:hypothetical protein
VVTSGATHSWISGLGTAPFTTGSTFKVRQKICQLESDWSATVVAEDAPSTLPEMTLDPAPVSGQPIVYFGGIVQGAGVTLTETIANVVAYSSVSVPYNAWRADVTGPLAGPVQANDDLVPTQSLCGVNSGDPDLPPPRPCNQETIVPRIAPPFAGDRFVLVTDSIPGSTVRVFDGATVELGNGAGNTIDLSRALVAGEVLMVYASLAGPPACSVNRAFSIVVQG